MQLLKDKNFLLFVGKFLGIFLFFYLGSLLVIGVSAPGGGYYSPFVDKYLDYISWIKLTLLAGSKFLLGNFGIDTYTTEDFRLRVVNGRGVLIAYDCVGYGVMSFWIAFVLASAGKILKKIVWVVTGLFVIWLINITRISLFLVSVDRSWKVPAGLDHHTLFNVTAYVAILLMMYIFAKKNDKIVTKKITLTNKNADPL